MAARSAGWRDRHGAVTERRPGAPVVVPFLGAIGTTVVHPCLDRGDGPSVGPARWRHAPFAHGPPPGGRARHHRRALDRMPEFGHPRSVHVARPRTPPLDRRLRPADRRRGGRPHDITRRDWSCPDAGRAVRHGVRAGDGQQPQIRHLQVRLPRRRSPTRHALPQRISARSQGVIPTALVLDRLRRGASRGPGRLIRRQVAVGGER
jgi:hypothetical protein